MAEIGSSFLENDEGGPIIAQGGIADYLSCSRDEMVQGIQSVRNIDGQLGPESNDGLTGSTGPRHTNPLTHIIAAMTLGSINAFGLYFELDSGLFVCGIANEN